METPDGTEWIVIHTIAKTTWTRYEKYRVELELRGHPKRVCWLSAAQHDYLITAFGYTKAGYSDSKCTVLGLFRLDGSYLRCEAHSQPPKPCHVTPLTKPDSEYGVSDDLRDDN